MVDNSATLDPSFPLDNSIGAMMIGVIVSAVLHGICLLQAFLYYQNYKKDVWYLKSLVILTVSFDAIHLAMISHAVYHYAVSYYHDEDQLRFLVWTVLMEALFTGVNGAVVQTFYTLRVWRLSKGNIILTGTILFLILATVGSGTAWVILSMQMETYDDLLKISPLTITINALSTAVDVAIAASLCIMLHNARTGFRKSDTIITKLIIFVVNTGVLTTCCAIASLIALIASPKSLIYATFYFCIGRFYTNSFLATLNARQSISSGMDDGTSHMMVSMPPSVVSPHGSHGGVGTLNGVNTFNGMNGKVKNISIRIDTHKEGEMDRLDTETQHGRSRSDDDLSSTAKHRGEYAM